MTKNACGLDCQQCPALARCGGRSNFCRLGSCSDCKEDPLMRMEIRRQVIEHLGGLQIGWHREVDHPRLPELPDHLPVLVQAYADPIDLPWVALHGGRILGVTGRDVTAKHRRPIREVYRLAARTRVALQLYVEDRVLEGLWAERRRVIPQLVAMDFDLILAPNMSVWRDQSRMASLVQIRRASVLYHELVDYVDSSPISGLAQSSALGLHTTFRRAQHAHQSVTSQCRRRHHRRTPR